MPETTDLELGRPGYEASAGWVRGERPAAAGTGTSLALPPDASGPGREPPGHEEVPMRRYHIATVAAILITATACTYQRAYVDYQEHTGDVRTRAGSWRDGS
jgi:hypothetical protein